MATLLEYVGNVHIYLGPYRGNPIALYLKRNGDRCVISPKVYPWNEVVGIGETPNKAAADFEDKWKNKGLSPEMYTGPSWEGGIKPDRPKPAPPPKPAAGPPTAGAAQPSGGSTSQPPAPATPEKPAAATPTAAAQATVAVAAPSPRPEGGLRDTQGPEGSGQAAHAAQSPQTSPAPPADGPSDSPSESSNPTNSSDTKSSTPQQS